MPEKNFLTTLEEFKGVDYSSSKLSGDNQTASSNLNLEFSETGSLISRLGSQPVGQANAFTMTHTYNYWDSVTGATVQELLGINDTLWRLKTSTLTVTGGANINWQMKADNPGLGYRFTIRNGTTAYNLGASNYLDLGSGLESEDVAVSNPKLITIEDLRAAIDANATLACALPAGIKFARVNLVQNSVSAVEVDAGHNYAVNDWFTCWDYLSGKLVARRVSAILAAPVRLQFDTNIFSVISVKDNQVLGPMASPAVSIGVRDTVDQTGATSISFSYWDLVPYTTWMYNFTDAMPFGASWASRNSASFIPPTFLNSNNCCYVSGGSNSQTKNSYEDYTFKYDGVTFYREGLPNGHTISPTVAGVGALTAGVYKYAAQFRQARVRGAEIFGSVFTGDAVTTPAASAVLLQFTDMQYGVGTNGSPMGYWLKNGVETNTTLIVGSFTKFANAVGYPVIGGSVAFIESATGVLTIRRVVAFTNTTVTISGPAVTINNGVPMYYGALPGFNYGGAIVNGNQADRSGGVGITVFNIPTAPNLIKVGDVITLLDSGIVGTTTPKITTRTVTAVTLTQIFWDATKEGNVSVLNADTISSGLVMDVYRTKVGGNIYYYLDSFPNYPFGLVTTYTDASADAALSYQLIEPPRGKEQDLPPKARFACNHQGTRCSAGDDDNPNTVAVYSTLDPESVPAASNTFDIPSSVNGPISTIASDGDDRLAIFKDHGYYQATGALDDGAFTVQTINEGDYGISSHHSVVRINGKIVGCGPLGVIAVSGGQVLSNFALPVFSPLANNANIKMSRAMGFNDYYSRHYVVFVPSVALSSTDYSNSLSFALDYGHNDAWFDRSYPGSVDQAGGMAMLNDNMYWLARTSGFGANAKEAGHLFKRIQPSSFITNPAYLYGDVDQGITRVWDMNWDYVQNISIDKEFLWLKIFSAPSSFESDRMPTNAFVLTLTVYKDFNDNTIVETRTLNFPVGTYEAKVKLFSTKMRAIRYKLVSSSLATTPYLTGYEQVVNLSYIVESPR